MICRTYFFKDTSRNTSKNKLLGNRQIFGCHTFRRLGKYQPRKIQELLIRTKYNNFNEVLISLIQRQANSEEGWRKAFTLILKAIIGTSLLGSTV